MKLELTKKAEKQLKSLPKVEVKKVSKKLDSIVNYPFSGKKLSGELEEYYSLKAWPYRIIYTISKENSKILIWSIRHRQGVYK